MWLTGCDLVELHERLQWIDRGDFFQDAQELLLVSQAAYADELRIDTNHGRKRCVLLNGHNCGAHEVATTRIQSREQVLGLIMHDRRVIAEIIDTNEDVKQLRVALFLLDCVILRCSSMIFSSASE